MHNLRYDGFSFSSLQPIRVLLSGSWLVGLISGIAYSYCSVNFVSLMRSAAYSTVSIVGVGAVLILPFLLSAFAVLISLRWLLIPLAYAKAFLFGACASAVGLSFGSAGWIIRMLLLFSGWTELPVFYWLWLRCLDGDRGSMTREFSVVLILLIAIGSIGYWIIAPFLASVI